MTSQSPRHTATYNIVDNIFRFDGPPDATVTIGGKNYLYFSGNSYLGLQAHPEVIAATCEAVLQYGISSATTRQRFTPTPVHAVEQNAAELYQTETAFYCPSGERAFEVVLQSLVGSFDAVYIDEQCRTALLKIVEVFAKTHSFPLHFVHHATGEHLAELLKRTLAPGKRPLMITEGVFEALGTIAPLDHYYKILSQYPDSILFLEDSHGLGVLGEQGRGTLEFFHFDLSGINQTQDELSQQTFDEFFSPSSIDLLENLESDGSFSQETFDEATGRNRPGSWGPFLSTNDASRTNLGFPCFPQDESSSSLVPPKIFPTLPPKKLPVRTFLTASLSKAIGGFGGIIPGSQFFIEHLNEMQQLHAETPPPTPIAAATAKGLSLSLHQETLRQKLLENTLYFKRRLLENGFDVDETPVPIVSLILGSPQNMRRFQQTLLEKQLLISYLPYQKKENSKGILRISLFSTHEKEMLDTLLHEMFQALN